MDMTVELHKGEIIKAVKQYLENKGYEVNEQDISFKLQKTGGKGGAGPGPKRLSKAKCKNVKVSD